MRISQRNLPTLGRSAEIHDINALVMSHRNPAEVGRYPTINPVPARRFRARQHGRPHFHLRKDKESQVDK